MTRMPIILLFATEILLPGLAGAVSEKDFEVQTTENLIILCTAAGVAGGYLYDHHEKAEQKAHDEAYQQGYEAGKKSQ